MAEPQIEDFIGESLAGGARKNALELAAYLKSNGMLFERGRGYWADKLYWMISFKGEYVCFILLNGIEDITESAGWTVWSDDSGSNCFAGSPSDSRTKVIAWENVDFCANCGGGCSPGTHRTIFGKEFVNVCRTAVKFISPDAEELECLKKLIEIRKNDILSKA